jgi:subtilisin-like proprotein convertase family protein
MKKTLIIAALVALAVVPSQAVIYSTNWTVNAAIPDNNLSGWANSQTVNTMPAGTLQGVAVTLTLNSGWTGDLFAYLVNDTGYAVLLDRVGTPGLTYGYGAGNLQIRLADDGFGTHDGFAGGGSFANVHGYGGGNSSLTTWNPDNDNAGLMLSGASGSLGSFTGGAANSTWSLYVADLSSGGVTTVQSWGLQMDIVAVPEVEAWIAAALAGAFGAFWVNRQMLQSGKNVESGA